MGMDSYVYKSSKENFETIINELKTNPTFFEGNMWDSENTVYAIKCFTLICARKMPCLYLGIEFTQLLDNYSDDVVITYYSWY